MTDEEKIRFGAKFKEFCEENFISKAAFARELGVKRQQLHPYFDGRSLPGAEILKKLADLGCDLHWLFGLEHVKDMPLALGPQLQNVSKVNDNDIIYISKETERLTDPPDQDIELLNILRAANIHSPEELKAILKHYEIIKEIFNDS